MKKVKESPESAIQQKVQSFSAETKNLLQPTQVWSFIHTKMDNFHASDAENKFVTVAAVMNLVSALIQIVFGLWLKSMSVVSSAIDSILDFALGFFNLFLLTRSKQKRDDNYNYGYGKLQGFGGLLQGGIMLFFGLVLGYFSVLKLISGGEVHSLGILIIIMILDFLGGIACVIYYHTTVKHSENMIVVGTLKKLYAGLLFNVGIMTGLVLIRVGLRYFDAERYFIDACVGLIVAIYICISGGGLVYLGFQMLMDKGLSPQELAYVSECIASYEEDRFHRDGLQTRTSGTTKYIEFTAYFDQKKYSFVEIYKTCLFLKQHLEKDIDQSVVTIIPRPSKLK